MNGDQPRRRRSVPVESLVRRWWFAAVAVAVIAFIVYGSFVPFRVHERTWSSAVEAYRWALTKRLMPESRADWIANVALGVPLGFALLGYFRLDRTGVRGTLLAAAAIVPATLLLAAAVEFGQLFFEGRTCAASDIWAQGIGAIVGVVLWMAFGTVFVRQLRSVFDRDAERSSTLLVLLGSISLVLLAAWLPFDLSASPRDLWIKLKSDATAVPFGELFTKPGRTPVDEWKKLGDWSLVFALAVPIGLLASGLPDRWRTASGLGYAAGLGLGVALVAEIGQLLVQSRHSSTTDVLFGTAGVLAGWIASLVLASRGVKKHRIEVAAVLVQFWCMLLAAIHWYPFDFFPGLASDAWSRASWLPLAGQAQQNYLWALGDLLEKFLVYAPLGAVIVWASTKHHLRSRTAIAAGCCALAALALECGQAMLPGRSVSPSDLLFGFFGGGLGAELARRSMGFKERVRLSTPAAPKVHAPPMKSLPIDPPKVVDLPDPAGDEPWWAAAEKRFPNRSFPLSSTTNGSDPT